MATEVDGESKRMRLSYLMLWAHWQRAHNGLLDAGKAKGLTSVSALVSRRKSFLAL